MIKKIGFIGAGNMGGALIRGLAPREDLEIHAFDLDQEKINNLAQNIEFTSWQSITDLIEHSDYIVLAVKPQVLKDVVREIKDHLNEKKCLISIAAGIKLKNLIKWSNNICPVVRVMPNTPALVGKGVFALCFDHDLTQNIDQNFITSLFATLGEVHILKEEYFDIFTALVGSGPAYVFYLLDSFIDAGLTFGLPRDMARKMVYALFEGSMHMVQNSSDRHLAELKEMVTSPGGTTIAGLNKLDQKAVKAAIIEAVEAACKRSKEIGGLNSLVGACDGLHLG
ncbi:pyrroline-5-carboxylate reductase [Desulfohalobiaceae bacterium Ax17]|uniref:pyrroline-5-carboxylate reductase n=1 Tax=Desulfovulcanus ferrireducens TaxID=2831190 RepID=UPI00207BA165|nr:pyrroline-5-carboxylate reductase [Desulfovulcanus ferrireducens]MBT8763892.1 pyrroline-5-carboxylate reductase [Desulfovulcanus ferrireducens]